MPKLIWITGTPNNGKTTLAKAIRTLRPEIAFFDADEVRQQLYPTLGYSDAERLANVKILANLAGTALRYGANAVVAAVSPLEAHRLYARDRAEELAARPSSSTCTASTTTYGRTPPTNGQSGRTCGSACATQLPR